MEASSSVVILLCEML